MAKAAWARSGGRITSALKRDDALKVLPDAFASDPERLARFQREAQVLASLNHPNIAHVHGLEQSDGVQALVMELVEGPTLADRIAQGPIPVDEALPIAKQIAEALEAAHEQGIIHRDLKPANIKVRPDGTVKVLDFGLAKALEPSSAARVDATASPTITSPAMMTGVGMLLGTAAYMSPEQARGKAVDKRSDIWAFGCVLYEMLTGRRAFEGEEVSDVLASVLAREPDWNALPKELPTVVETFVRRCLQKDRRQRVQDIGDIRLALEGAFGGFEAPTRQSPRAGVRMRQAISGVAGLSLRLLRLWHLQLLGSRRLWPQFGSRLSFRQARPLAPAMPIPILQSRRTGCVSRLLPVARQARAQSPRTRNGSGCVRSTNWKRDQSVARDPRARHSSHPMATGLVSSTPLQTY